MEEFFEDDFRSYFLQMIRSTEQLDDISSSGLKETNFFSTERLLRCQLGWGLDRV